MLLNQRIFAVYVKQHNKYSYEIQFTTTQSITHINMIGYQEVKKVNKFVNKTDNNPFLLNKKLQSFLSTFNIIIVSNACDINYYFIEQFSLEFYNEITRKWIKINEIFSNNNMYDNNLTRVDNHEIIVTNKVRINLHKFIGDISICNIIKILSFYVNNTIMKSQKDKKQVCEKLVNNDKTMTYELTIPKPMNEQRRVIKSAKSYKYAYDIRQKDKEKRNMKINLNKQRYLFD